MSSASYVAASWQWSGCRQLAVDGMPRAWSIICSCVTQCPRRASCMRDAACLYHTWPSCLHMSARPCTLRCICMHSPADGRPRWPSMVWAAFHTLCSWMVTTNRLPPLWAGCPARSWKVRVALLSCSSFQAAGAVSVGARCCGTLWMIQWPNYPLRLVRALWELGAPLCAVCAVCVR